MLACLKHIFLSGCTMRVLTAFGLLLFALAAQAQLFRWTDESGKVHYTDTQPPANAKNVEKKGSARAGGTATATRLRISSRSCCGVLLPATSKS